MVADNPNLKIPSGPPQKRRVSVGKAKVPEVDYGILKSMIRDEVDLQVKRQIKQIIQPLYQVIMTDDSYATRMPELPDWLRQIAEGNVPRGNDDDDEPFFLRDDENPWR